MIRRPNEPWHTPPVVAYDNERALQNILLDSPGLLPGIESAAVIDEMSISDTGSVDLVLVEPSGAITLVECKLRANPEIRRAVIGQIMAYAANLWKLGYESLDQRFQNRLGTSLAEAVAGSIDDDPTWSEEAFRLAVAENLEAGRFRLVIAVEEITDELKRLVRDFSLMKLRRAYRDSRTVA